VETGSDVREFTNISTCEMKSTHIYSAFDARTTPRDKVNWLAVASTARHAVHVMKLAMNK
jgi:hypothetical protein